MMRTDGKLDISRTTLVYDTLVQDGWTVYIYSS